MFSGISDGNITSNKLLCSLLNIYFYKISASMTKQNVFLLLGIRYVLVRYPN